MRPAPFNWYHAVLKRLAEPPVHYDDLDRSSSRVQQSRERCCGRQKQLLRSTSNVSCCAVNSFAIHQQTSEYLINTSTMPSVKQDSSSRRQQQTSHGSKQHPSMKHPPPLPNKTAAAGVDGRRAAPGVVAAAVSEVSAAVEELHAQLEVSSLSCEPITASEGIVTATARPMYPMRIRQVQTGIHAQRRLPILQCAWRTMYDVSQVDCASSCWCCAVQQ
jgi:hypothetical protein